MHFHNIFQENDVPENQNTLESEYSENSISKDTSNFNLTGNDFASLYNYADKSEIKMIFDLNVLLRNENGTWNSENAEEIMDFAKSHDMKIDWQMGNGKFN